MRLDCRNKRGCIVDSGEASSRFARREVVYLNLASFGAIVVSVVLTALITARKVNVSSSGMILSIALSIMQLCPFKSKLSL